VGVKWHLKSFVVHKHQIYTATDLQRLVLKKTGIVISISHLCNYLNKKPKMIRFESLEIVCSALGCNLNDFFQITPKKMNPNRKRKLAHNKTPQSKIAVKSFPDPEDYGPHS